ncbi:unnamed protein product [Amaranthus hypochondriacus]
MSRRSEDLRMKTSIVSARDRRDDMDEEPYFTSRRGSSAREELPLRSRRSLSPQEGVDRSRRPMVRDRRSNSLEKRKNYDVHIDQVRGGGHMLSRSPPIEHPQKRQQLMDERAFVTSPTSMRLQRNFEYVEYEDYNNLNSRSRNSYTYDDHSEVVKHKDYSTRRSGSSGHRLLVESIPFEDTVERDVGLRPNYAIASRHVEPSGKYSTMDMHRVKDGKTRYQDVISNEKLVKEIHYKDGEQSAHYARDSQYIDLPLSQTKDYGGEELLKNNPSTSSSIIVRGEYVNKIRDVRTLSSDGYPKRYGKDLEHHVSDEYGPRIVSDTRRGYETICRDAKCYACDAYQASRLEHKEYMYPEVGVRVDDETAYVSQEHLYGKTKHARDEHVSRGFFRPDLMESHENIPNAEGSRRIIKNVGAREFDVIEKEMAPDYGDIRKSSDVLIEAGNFLDDGYSHGEITRKVSNHHHVSDHGGLHEHDFDDPHSGHGYGSYAPGGSDRTRLKNSSEYRNVELQRHAGGFERIKGDEIVNNDRLLKRKYSAGEEVSRTESRSEMRNKWNIASGNDDFYEHHIERTSRRASIMQLKRPSGNEREQFYPETKRSSRDEHGRFYLETEQMPDETYCHKDSNDVGWTSYQDHSGNIYEHSGKPFKMGNRYLKGYTKSEPSKSYSHVHHTHQKTNHYKHQSLGQRNENDNNVAIPAQVADVPDESRAPWKSEPMEDSEGFKQRIQTAFLDFSKRFNENPTARKLYKEDGKAGSLFCVVCRRSASKAFQNTKALASHAFMSHKNGLRPQHLGLHRALCVLMGWNRMPDPETGTWSPEPLPGPEALALKEDLILWPPIVIVHNISLSNNDHNKWKLINIDALEEFLRDKGFHLGKMKICLGNPGDHSVILVKFLGTFSGLQEAERLNKIFLDRKHGRLGFDQAISGSGAMDESMKGDNQSEKLEDVLLYGYMGISEDLDSVDFDTKKRCSVKSKKEIHEIADAPVKAE